MRGVLFRNWEAFTESVRIREGIEKGEGWEEACKLFDVDELEADEWEGLRKMLSEEEYTCFSENRSIIEVRSFCLNCGKNRTVIYAAGEEEEGQYACMGYAVISEGTGEDYEKYVCLTEEAENRKEIYITGTEKSYWEMYGVLQKFLPEQVLDYLLFQVQTLDCFYGTDRDLEKDMGGFCAVVPQMNQAGKKAYHRLLKKYSIDESLYEYSDVIPGEKQEWTEWLYLLNNDYGIVAVYPNGRKE